MSSFKNYFTREAHNNPLRLFFAAPDGSGAEDWIDIVGLESDKFRSARDESERSFYAGLTDIKDAEKRAEYISAQAKDSKLRMIASLVVGWSFDEECNVENALLLLAEAPFIADQIDRKAASTKEFLAKKPKNSLDTENPSLS